jgi:hypothetical protein
MALRDRAVLGLTGVVAAAVPLGLATYAEHRCARGLGDRLTALTGLPSRIGGVEAGLTGTVRLSDVAVGDLFAARAIEARVALPNLLAGRLSADEIQVEAPRLRARVVGTDVDAANVMRRIASRRAARPARPAGGVRPVRRIVVTEGDLVVEVAGVGTLAASDVELHPQASGVRVVTGAVRIHADGAGVHADAGFERAAADVALPAVRVERMVATGGHATARGPGGPALALGGATVTFGMGARAIRATGDVDDAGVPRPVELVLAGDAVAVTLDHVPLAAAAPWLPAALAVGDARLTGTIDASRIDGGVAIAARGELAGAALASPTIADRPVPLDVSGRLTARHRGAALDVDATLAAGKANLVATAHLDRGVTGWDHGGVRVTVPPTSCLDVLDAIPRPLRGATAGLTVDGTASARFDLKLAGTAEPGQAVRLAARVDVGGCRVLAEAPGGDPARLATAREHVFFDGSRRRIGPGTDGWVRLDDLYGYVPGAFVAAEDARFWDHGGFDVEQIARSLEVDLRERRLARGGSTISQQLVKNVYLGPERTFARKLQEAILTWRLEATTAKRTILEQYLNVIELGPGVFGLDAAARHWFDKPATRLTTRQAAFLAALTPEPRSMTARIRAAGGLDRRSKERVDVVLRAMKRGGVIDADRLDTARASDLDFRPAALQ